MNNGECSFAKEISPLSEIMVAEHLRILDWEKKSWNGVLSGGFWFWHFSGPTLAKISKKAKWFTTCENEFMFRACMIFGLKNHKLYYFCFGQKIGSTSRIHLSDTLAMVATPVVMSYWLTRWDIQGMPFPASSCGRREFSQTPCRGSRPGPAVAKRNLHFFSKVVPAKGDLQQKKGLLWRGGDCSRMEESQNGPDPAQVKELIAQATAFHVIFHHRRCAVIGALVLPSKPPGINK